MSVPLPPGDPAMWMLERGIKDPSWRTVVEVYRPSCYICRDPEFALMGMPLCKPCQVCTTDPADPKGHVAADDTVCDDCGADAYEEYMRRNGDGTGQGPEDGAGQRYALDAGEGVQPASVSGDENHQEGTG